MDVVEDCRIILKYTLDWGGGVLVVVHWIKLVQVEAIEILDRATHETLGFSGNFL
jgi:hypothetical protein